MNELISQYYDKELNDSQLLSFEAKLAKSSTMSEYCNNKCETFDKISRSLNLCKNRIKHKLKYEKQKPNFNYKKGIINRLLYHFFEEYL